MLDNETITVDVGGRLRQLRQERGKSMRALARASGLSTNALSMIERARTSPSVSTLQKIAQALNVPITAFFRTEPPRQDIVFRKVADQKQIKIGYGQYQGFGGEYFTGNIEPFILTLEPGAGSGLQGSIHTGHEFIMCLSGKIEYVVRDEVYIMEPGDTLIFSAQNRHHWRNSGEAEARAICVLAGYENGERPSEYHI